MKEIDIVLFTSNAELACVLSWKLRFNITCQANFVTCLSPIHKKIVFCNPPKITNLNLLEIFCCLHQALNMHC